MYTAKCDGKILYDLRLEVILSTPVLNLAENSAGSFTFAMPPDHPLYDSIQRMISEIVVYRDGEEIWSGRPTEETTDFYGMRTVYCEGELAYLNDTVQLPSESHNASVQGWLGMLIRNHNAKAPKSRQFTLGTVTVQENLYRYTNWETTWECISEKLIKRIGGHIRIRKENGVRYLDYLAEYPKTSSQIIRFGQNLIDYARNYNLADIATVCIPLGTTLTTTDIAALEKYLDVSSVNKGSVYVENSEAIKTYGRIIKVVHWDDVTTAAELLKKGKAWVNGAQYEDLQLDVKAVDFHLVDNGVPAIDMLDRIRVISDPHGLDRYFPVTAMKIPLSSPGEMELTLGSAEQLTMSASTNQRTQELKDAIGKITPTATILDQAATQTAEIVTGGTLGRHVVTLPDEEYISEGSNIDTSQRMYKWDYAGLGYSDTGRYGDFSPVMDMDGAVNADRITKGTMSANRLGPGTLTIGSDPITVVDADGQLILVVDLGGIHINRGTIGSIQWTDENGQAVDGVTADVQAGTSILHLYNGVCIGIETQ